MKLTITTNQGVVVSEIDKIEHYDLTSLTSGFDRAKIINEIERAVAEGLQLCEGCGSGANTVKEYGYGPGDQTVRYCQDCADRLSHLLGG